MTLLPAASFSDLMTPGELTDTSLKLNGVDWGNRPIFVNLFIFVITRFILIPISIVVPIPCGLFVPCLSLGGGIGRIFGEIIKLILDGSPLLWEGGHIYPGIYAIVGAAAFTGAVTDTLSVAVIVFEITGGNVYIIPVLIAICVSIATGRRISSMGIYDSICTLKGLPFLPDLKQDTYTLQAGDIMEKDVKSIAKDFQYDEVVKLLDENPEVQSFPVVHSNSSPLLIGTVDREILEQLRQYHDRTDAPPALETMDSSGNLVTGPSEAPTLFIRPTPIRFVTTTPLAQMHILFSTIKLPTAYVTQNGKLKGVITRTTLKKAIEQTDRKMTLFKD
eukprot:TRINITY_DN7606_c0_g1_i1.p1 TRINITY_DN7606_c0_g1~~TRINITY_DN7606_c0_g1_i1.p1  ORF type:complete len:333 (-),score=79.07 TRINITY_DN7606_c0_g1_i1:94-1092(-)